MIKILFSPSEGKTTFATNSSITKDSFIFPEYYYKREFIIDKYIEYIFSLDDENLNKYFGIKNAIDYKIDIKKVPTTKAILRYDGVAYDYLEYQNLDNLSQQYIDKHTLIFSNLFGMIKADDLIPVYRMKQGRNIGDIDVASYYKNEFSSIIDEYLKDSLVVDLRASHYDKFYKPKNSITMKFLKNSRVVSHWAKAYRGIVLKEMAKNQVKTKEELFALKIPNLSIKEIQQNKTKTIIVYTIGE